MVNTTSTETSVADKVAYICPGLAQIRQKLGDKARREPRFCFYSLYGHIYHIETLRTAWKLIRYNGQTPGVDRVTYEDIEGNGDIEKNVNEYLQKIQEELKTRTYRPAPVRRIYIPKSDGKMRPLGIPTIKDRITQMATLLIIEPIFEEDFLECSYGFRPNKSAHDALREIVKNFREGRTAILDADLKGYFDSIPHDQLMKCVRMRISDSSVLKLIERWLKAPIIEEEKNDKGKWNIKITKPTQGTPQGGVISPILANIYLHWFDKRFHDKDGPRNTANARLIRYADDFMVMAKYIGNGIKDRVKYLIEDWLKLEINQEKTRIVTLKNIGDSVDFLGYTFRVEKSLDGRDHNYIRMEPKKKSIMKAKDAIRELTKRSRNYIPINTFIDKLNQFLRGWCEYFKLGQPSRVFRHMDYYAEQKVVKHLRRRSQRGYKKPEKESWYFHLRKLGLIRLDAHRQRTL